MARKTFVTLFVIAVVMRVAFIARAPLWYDENFTLILARLPFWTMIQATAGDVHPPLWYLLEWSIYHAAPGLPVWFIRVPALVFSLAAFWMFAKLIIVLQVPGRMQIGALTLMAILPMQIWYAQEGRMYSMLEFLVLSALYAGLKRRWVWFTLSAIALCYTQNYGLIYCAVIGFVIVAVLDWDKEHARYFGYAIALTGMAYLPWVLVILGQMSDIEGRYWIIDTSAGAVLNIFYKQFWISAMDAPGILSSYVVTFAALIIGVYAMMREKLAAWFTVMTMAFAPLGLSWLASMLWQPILLHRPLIGISPFLYIIVTAPFNHERSIVNRQSLYAACFAVPIFIFGIGGYYINVADMKGEGIESPILETLTYVTDNWQDGDILYYADDGPMVDLMPYTSMPQFRMPECETPILGELSDATRAALGVSIAELSDVSYTRAWVYAPRSPMHPLCYERQIAGMAPIGKQVITVDDSEYITSGVWLVEK